MPDILSRLLKKQRSSFDDLCKIPSFTTESKVRLTSQTFGIDGYPFHCEFIQCSVNSKTFREDKTKAIFSQALFHFLELLHEISSGCTSIWVVLTRKISVTSQTCPNITFYMVSLTSSCRSAPISISAGSDATVSTSSWSWILFWKQLGPCLSYISLSKLVIDLLTWQTSRIPQLCMCWLSYQQNSRLFAGDESMRVAEILRGSVTWDQRFISSLYQEQRIACLRLKVYVHGCGTLSFRKGNSWFKEVLISLLTSRRRQANG